MLAYACTFVGCRATTIDPSRRCGKHPRKSAPAQGGSGVAVRPLVAKSTTPVTTLQLTRSPCPSCFQVPAANGDCGCY